MTILPASSMNDDMKTERLTISIPTRVRTAVKNQVALVGGSESSYISEVIARILNVGKEGVSARDSDQIFRLAGEINALVQSDSQHAEAQRLVLSELTRGSFAHPDLRAALPWFLLQAATDAPRLFAAMDDRSVYVPQFDYSTPLIRLPLIDLLHKWNASRLAGLNFKFLRPEERAFDAIINLEFTLSARTVFSFPFFLTEFRRALFGVVQYGSHVATGFLIRPDSPLFAKDIDPAELKAYAMLSSDEAKGKRMHFLSELFTWMNQDNKALRLYTRDNYLNREILPLLKTAAHQGLQISTFSERRFVQTEGNDDDWKRVAGDTELAKNAVFLYDLAADNHLANEIESLGFHKIPFLHGQQIPVGIGFSLPALPFMARVVSGQTVAEHMRLKVVEAVKRNEPSNLAQKFWADGILLSDDLRDGWNPDGFATAEL